MPPYMLKEYEELKATNREPLAQTWLARAGFYDFGSPSIATTSLYSIQLAPGQAAFQGLSYTVLAYKILKR